MEEEEENIINCQSEINIGFFGIGQVKFPNIINELSKSSFSDEFNLKQINFFDNNYTCAEFNKIKKEKNNIIKNEKNKEDYFGYINDYLDDIKENLKIKINNCNIVKKGKKDDEKYNDFIKTKIDFYFIFDFEIKEKKIFEQIKEYSQGNFIFFDSENKNNKEKEQYDELIISENDNNEVLNSGKKALVLTTFLKELHNKFNMFLMLQKYSVEKKIITFKEYLNVYDEYNNIQSEKELINLFNDFEKFSFNNDYADNTLILLQIISNKNLFKKKLYFIPKSLVCGFCEKQLDISELDKTLKLFICKRCRNIKFFMEKTHSV